MSVAQCAVSTFMSTAAAWETKPAAQGGVPPSADDCFEPALAAAVQADHACIRSPLNGAGDWRLPFQFVAKRWASTDEERREVYRIALSAVASGALDDFRSEWRSLDDKRFPFPADAFTELAADALGLADVTRSEPVSLDDFAERYLPEYEFRGNTAHQKVRAALNLAVGMHAGVVPDYSGIAGWWQQQDLSWYSFVVLVLMVRIAEERTGRPIADVCSELAVARGIGA